MKQIERMDLDTPVYPLTTQSYSERQSGITLFYFYAAQAPDIIPRWFVHKEPDKSGLTKKALWTDGKDEAEQKILKDFVDEQIQDLPPAQKWFADQNDAWWNDKIKWERDDKSARYFQWRKFYAEQLIETLNK